MNKQQRIVNLIKLEYERANKVYMTAVAEHAAAIAQANVCFNKYDGVGGFSINPYNISSKASSEMNARTYLAHIKEAYEFAVDTFIQK